MITKRDCLAAMENIKLAMTQLVPDGHSCAVCGDTGHQAFECHFNPLVVQEKIENFTNTWRCFHCNEIFTDPKEAEEHFGERSEMLLLQGARPVCVLSA